MANNNYNIKDEYLRKARFYPSVLAITPVVIVFVALLVSSNWLLDSNVSSLVWRLIGVFLPSTLVSAALSFMLVEFFRTVSKRVCQDRQFGKEELHFPTTERLLWKSKSMSKQWKGKIRDRIKHDFDINLLDETSEQDNEDEARKLIVEAVGLMRQSVTGDRRLFLYNVQYGFWRNLFGALVCTIPLMIILVIVSLAMDDRLIWLYTFFLVVEILLLIYAWITIRYNGEEYAKRLFFVYYDLSVKNNLITKENEF